MTSWSDFLEDMTSLGNRISQARVSYDEAMAKLSSGRGNLVNQVEQLKQLGAKASKSLRQVSWMRTTRRCHRRRRAGCFAGKRWRRAPRANEPPQGRRMGAAGSGACAVGDKGLRHFLRQNRP